MAERSAAALHWVGVTLVLWGLTRLIPPTGNPPENLPRPQTHRHDQQETQEHLA